jgi:putative resolvase
MYVSTALAKSYYNIDNDSLYKLADEGKINFVITKGTHRRYYIPEQNDLITDDNNEYSKKFAYIRVSSHKQKSYLHDQIQFISDNYPNHTIITDIGSGLDFKRNGLVLILDKVISGELTELVVIAKDRLARFGIELIENIFDNFDAKLIVADNDIDLQRQKQFKDELSVDILSIIAYFTEEYNGIHPFMDCVDNSVDNPNCDSHNDSVEDAIDNEKVIHEQKKGRGRPSKQIVEEIEETLSPEPKKSRGRPSKQIVEEIEETLSPEPKKSRGRPVKQTQLEITSTEPKKSRGRPSKQKDLDIGENISPEPKRGRGRPVKENNEDIKTLKIKGKNVKSVPIKQNTQKTNKI